MATTMSKRKWTNDEIRQFMREKNQYIHYYNPEDSNLFVTKRSRLGWTVNFANPFSWLFVGGIALFVFIISFVER